jgi:hypothetical protein
MRGGSAFEVKTGIQIEAVDKAEAMSHNGRIIIHNVLAIGQANRQKASIK